MFHALPYTPRINFFLKRTRFGGGSEKRGRHSPPNRLCSTPSFIHHGIIIFWKGYDLTTWEKHKFWKWHDLGEDQKSEDVTLPPNRLCSTSSSIHEGKHVFWKLHDIFENYTGIWFRCWLLTEPQDHLFRNYAFLDVYIKANRLFCWIAPRISCTFPNWCFPDVLSLNRVLFRKKLFLDV